ncbi:hypothetical protein EDD95_5199 [Streptomyces sp. CEV 2-1]|nr:hypothetical protein EDD95_5199 [Streptomyces sp. CEV 2-1]
MRPPRHRLTPASYSRRPAAGTVTASGTIPSARAHNLTVNQHLVHHTHDPSVPGVVVSYETVRRWCRKFGQAWR